jgi:hypothetical protein
LRNRVRSEEKKKLHLAVGTEREVEAIPPPSAVEEADGFGDIISPSSVLVLGSTRWIRDGLEM